ncbi:peptidoglycan/xylan/chitin deacetylase (PgdA/CDA1 family) [Pullulanibacillus pueri]|uniref:Polysaccharide deacetylase familiy protein n=1 Tax=Pullulanibacillus pueri TaxID=1437324 RepID=A0A8J3EN26_9BACL|nr:polysaccharide deacetylase family protein [Pullulanibacillus pueri]MBM7683696.1 peptidoglycan/xylan/chitin deacetylase (PgdA/CDA1 family) [Pullulanibacillus pueri]GGH85242.1 polysaccharide deacetylase familiy protein [Pullulanibacillus pueri]
MFITILIFAIILVIFLLYDVLPTVLMRTFSIGVLKKSTVKGKVALTFDDGPDPRHTLKLLDLLKRYQVQATFFVVGECAEKHPEILKRMNREGHSIGIHHYKHKSNWFLMPSQTRFQCQKTAEIIKRITGKAPKYYRPPWGKLNLFTYWVARPYKLVIWSAILGDWSLKLGKQRLLERLYRNLCDGAVIVLHDSNQSPGADNGAADVMIEALEVFLPNVYQTYRFVTVDELFPKEHLK